jgi:hypothetical protein
MAETMLRQATSPDKFFSSPARKNFKIQRNEDNTMNLKTWFKGLGVFVLSSFVTALATMTLDPASFNLSRDGLMKVGAAALVIGVKSVLLYLKQSPLPSPQPGFTNWTRISSVAVCCLIMPAPAMISGCGNSWEQTTYASLAASKALIDCAVAGYNHFDVDIRHACAADPQDPAFDAAKFYLPQTRDAQQAIEKARQAQIAAVEAFAAYAVAKIGKDTSATVAEKQAAVFSYLQQLPTLLGAVRTLTRNGPMGAGPAADPQRPLASIAALRPSLQLQR